MNNQEYISSLESMTEKELDSEFLKSMTQSMGFGNKLNDILKGVMHFIEKNKKELQRIPPVNYPTKSGYHSSYAGEVSLPG